MLHAKLVLVLLVGTLCFGLATMSFAGETMEIGHPADPILMDYAQITIGPEQFEGVVKFYLDAGVLNMDVSTTQSGMITLFWFDSDPSRIEKYRVFDVASDTTKQVWEFPGLGAVEYTHVDGLDPQLTLSTVTDCQALQSDELALGVVEVQRALEWKAIFLQDNGMTFNTEIAAIYSVIDAASLGPNAVEECDVWNTLHSGNCVQQETREGCEGCCEFTDAIVDLINSVLAAGAHTAKIIGYVLGASELAEQTTQAMGLTGCEQHADCENKEEGPGEGEHCKTQEGTGTCQQSCPPGDDLWDPFGGACDGSLVCCAS